MSCGNELHCLPVFCVNRYLLFWNKLLKFPVSFNYWTVWDNIIPQTTSPCYSWFYRPHLDLTLYHPFFSSLEHIILTYFICLHARCLHASDHAHLPSLYWFFFSTVDLEKREPELQAKMSEDHRPLWFFFPFLLYTFLNARMDWAYSNVTGHNQNWLRELPKTIYLSDIAKDFYSV